MASCGANHHMKPQKMWRHFEPLGAKWLFYEKRSISTVIFDVLEILKNNIEYLPLYNKETFISLNVKINLVVVVEVEVVVVVVVVVVQIFCNWVKSSRATLFV